MRKIMDVANTIFKAAYNAVLPHRLIRNSISIDSNDQNLSISIIQRKYPLKKNVYVAAFGKAACGMSRAVDELLHEHIQDGVVSMPRGTRDLFRRHQLMDLLPRDNSRLRYYEGASNNLPDQNAYQAALEIKAMMRKLSGDDLLIVLISGGGSALLPCPPEGISLEEKIRLIKFLSQRGADINELNTVRQNLSELKGGRLAELAAENCQNIISLIVSDIVGDPLDLIASGPTCQRKTKALDALEIIRKYDGDQQVEMKNICTFLGNSKEEKIDPKIYDHVTNVIIGNNRTALEAARIESEKLNFQTEIVSDSVIGEAKFIGRSFANQLQIFLSHPGKRCWLWGGETTVRVKGSGLGGRNQEMVLAFALEIVRSKLIDRIGRRKFAFLSAGTDGQDGPTDAAGAVIDSDHLKSMTDQDLDWMKECLEKNDSYTFFDRFSDGKCHVKCGLTGTNVMDVQIMILE